MRTQFFGFVVVAAGLLAGCGGGSSAYAPSYTPSGYGAADGYATGSAPSYGAAPNARTASAPQTGVSVAPVPPPRVDGDEPVAVNESQRPGLGTEWGETRYSRVHDVSFLRSDELHPFGVAMLNYNDRAGVDALAARESVRNTGYFREVPAGGGAIVVSIRGENGDLLPAIKVSDRTFVIGQEGQRYSIVMTNRTNHRFEAVATVDGLDVVNGQVGDLHNRGYVLMPYATVEVDGFRQSHEAVAAFRFARVSDSYAAQTVGDRHVGVIGVAFFSERGDVFTTPYSAPIALPPPPDATDLQLRETASPFPNDPRFARPPR
jgi:hypothetical protein